MSNYPFSPQEMLELCLSLVTTQIREEQINSFEELHSFADHIKATLDSMTPQDRGMR